MVSSSPSAIERDWMFDRIVSNLQSLFGYSSQKADEIATEYYVLFRDKTFCDSVGISVQDEDYFAHEAPMGMAMRIHYYLGLKGDFDPQKFLQWRKNFQIHQREIESGL